MILRLSAVSASAAWPQITGIKSRASHHYQPSNYQPSNCTTSLPTTETNLPTVLSAYQQCTPFHISPPRTQADQFVGNALSDSNEGSFKAVLGQDDETCYARKKLCEFGCCCPKETVFYFTLMIPANQSYHNSVHLLRIFAVKELCTSLAGRAHLN